MKTYTRQILTLVCILLTPPAYGAPPPADPFADLEIEIVVPDANSLSFSASGDVVPSSVSPAGADASREVPLEKKAGPTAEPVTTLIEQHGLSCANWIYAGSKSSVCFSPKFLAVVNTDTRIRAREDFTAVPLAEDAVFLHPFAIMTGEGSFALNEQERRNMKAYLMRGGFLLASAGCSSRKWAQSFLNEFKKVFPDKELQDIPMDHPLFRTCRNVPSIRLKKGSTTLLKGLTLDGRIVMIYTSEGLNDTSSVDGCCCCGGNEILNSQEINVNIFVYSVLH